MTKNRSRRLRKKIRVGEFQEYGFWITFMLPNEKDTDAEFAFARRFIVEALNKQGLIFGGPIGEKTNGFATLKERGSVTDTHRQVVKDWLSAKQNVTNIVIGELVRTKGDYSEHLVAISNRT